MNNTDKHISSLIQDLQKRGLSWIHAQMVTGLLESEIEKAYERGVNDGLKQVKPKNTRQ
jgi:hypothetical protein